MSALVRCLTYVRRGQCRSCVPAPVFPLATFRRFGSRDNSNRTNASDDDLAFFQRIPGTMNFWDALICAIPLWGDFASK